MKIALISLGGTISMKTRSSNISKDMKDQHHLLKGMAPTLSSNDLISRLDSKDIEFINIDLENIPSCEINFKLLIKTVKLAKKTSKRYKRDNHNSGKRHS